MTDTPDDSGIVHVPVKELVERLRNVGWDTWEQCVTGISEEECAEAATILIQQAAEIEALREALESCGRNADQPTTIEMIVSTALTEGGQTDGGS